MVENYQLAKADNFKGWICHHRLETHTSDGELRKVQLTRTELIALETYFFRPASELIFMKRSEHCALHRLAVQHSAAKRTGKQLSGEHKKKISNSSKGFKMPEWFSKEASERMLGDKNPMKRTEQRKRQSERMKIAAKGNTNVRGMKWKLVDGKRVYYREEEI